MAVGNLEPEPYREERHVGPGYGASLSRLDEDDVRVRPGRSSRPRTRTRPRHQDAVPGFVIAVDRGRFTCRVDGRDITAMRARELGRRSVVVGDRVAVVGELGGGPDALARIVRVTDRTSALRRTADDTDPVERVVVANADTLVVVTALVDPPPRTGLVDRCLVAAYDAGLDPVLCLTKSDLGSPESLLATYRPLGVAAVVVGRTDAGAGVEALRERLTGRLSVLIGHSGVGKSTLVNALVPAAERATGTVNPVTGRGRHTSSSAVALQLDEDGWVIDTPGLRSFGLAHVSADRVVAAFTDLAPGTENCPQGCSHLIPRCALDEWVAAGRATPGRLRSLRHLLANRVVEP